MIGELAALRRGAHLPHCPIHGDCKLGNAVELTDYSWCNLDLDFVRVGERVYDVAASLHWAFDSGVALTVGELVDAYDSTAPRSPRWSAACCRRSWLRSRCIG